MLAGEFRIGPDISSFTGERGSNPLPVLRNSRNERVVNWARRIIVSDVSVFDDSFAGRRYGPCVGVQVPARQPFIQGHRQAGRHIGGQQIDALLAVNVRSFETHVAKDLLVEPGIPDGL